MTTPASIIDASILFDSVRSMLSLKDSDPATAGLTVELLEFHIDPVGLDLDEHELEFLEQTIKYLKHCKEREEA